MVIAAAKYRILTLILMLLVCTYANAQGVLQKSITINASQQRLGTVLHLMEQRGNFTFSYNSNLVPKDSLVNLHIANQSVKSALDQLLSNRFEYREAQNFIILRYAPSRLTLTTDKVMNEDHSYHISGFIINEQNGQKLANASVYDRRTLQSALTDQNGYFDIKLKNEVQPITLTISKENYRDTTVTFLSDVTINGTSGDNEFTYLPGDLSRLDQTGLGRFFISTKQQIQAVNLGGLITRQPFQASIVPGLSSHGSLSGQVVNKVSLNLAGGYNAGVNGAEVGGVFNLDRGDVTFFQMATVFNEVGGTMSGIQLAGAFNHVLSGVKGFQFGGGFNFAEGRLNGVQLAIGLNRSKQMEGVQASVAMNIATGDAEGGQIALGNIAQGKFSGVQFGPLFNYARNLRGVQFGLINISDTSSGASIGLINLVRHGYHRIVINTNETVDANLLYKTGTAMLHNIVLVGADLSGNKKLYEGGLGFGNQINVFKWLALNTEISTRYLYQGDTKYTNLLNRLDVGINIKLGRSLSIIGGPSYNYYYSDQKQAINGYAYVKDESNHHSTSNTYFTRWLGWTAGITLFNY
ncbi:STN and carboxypeptidase regulatory-like domain-containing protein [Mucilaginibacter agri]|nr:STN and carboxypeptidase regulatory-like domain-containing protein [Mucilaginibacter agri]